MRLSWLCLAYCLLGVTQGCAESAKHAMDHEPSAAVALAPPPVLAARDQADPIKGEAAPPKGAAHKIIRTAQVQLIVADLGAGVAKIVELADKMGGYVANSNVHGKSGITRRGTWKVRIPAAAYDEFLAAIEKLGEVQSLSTDAQDVTAEFYDLEARIHNKKQEETRLLKHLEQSTGKLDEILNVEREISRVREEVERMEGRRNVLQDLTSMTTVTLDLSESRQFVSPGAPIQRVRLSSVFLDSVEALRATGMAFLIVLVVLSPWLLVASLGYLCFRILRRLLGPRPVR